MIKDGLDVFVDLSSFFSLFFFIVFINRQTDRPLSREKGGETFYRDSFISRVKRLYLIQFVNVLFLFPEK